VVRQADTEQSIADPELLLTISPGFLHSDLIAARAFPFPLLVEDVALDLGHLHPAFLAGHVLFAFICG
jgi:hypothetical protein